DLRQAEIQKLDSRFGHQDICRFQIAMRNAFTMCGIESAADLHGVGKSPIQRQWTLELPSVDILHHQVIGADVVKGTDVRVIERGHGPSLPFEAFREVDFGYFYRDDPVKPGVPRLPDLAHTTCTD